MVAVQPGCFCAGRWQPEDHGRMKTVRRDIARICTIVRERELGLPHRPYTGGRSLMAVKPPLVTSVRSVAATSSATRKMTRLLSSRPRIASSTPYGKVIRTRSRFTTSTMSRGRRASQLPYHETRLLSSLARRVMETPERRSDLRSQTEIRSAALDRYNPEENRHDDRVNRK